MTRQLSVPEFGPSAIGFDRMFNQLTKTFANSKDCAYPPYNIIHDEEYKYRIEIAVAGFDKDEIEITVEDMVLTIRGEKTEKPDNNYVYRGLSNRKFLRKFNLAEYVEVKDATLNNGILTISLEQVLPEAIKPKRIEITAE